MRGDSYFRLLYLQILNAWNGISVSVTIFVSEVQTPSRAASLL